MSFSSKKLGIIRKNGIKYFVLFLSNTAQKMKFSIRVSSVNVTKSADSCGFGHTY